MDYVLLTTHYLLLTTYYLLATIYYLILTTYYLALTTHYLLVLELHLYGDTWMPEVGEADGGAGATSQLLQALASSQSEARGWNSEIVAAMGAQSVVRLSDSVVLISLPRGDNFSITQPETIDITIPPVSVRSDASIRVEGALATPEWARWPMTTVHPIVIHPRPGVVHLASDLSNETDMQVRHTTRTPIRRDHMY